MRLPVLVLATTLLSQLVASSSFAQIPTVLTDKIHKGSGSIDLMLDTTSSDLTQYLDSGTMYLGVDLNEDASGNESRDSVGIAIEQMELVIQTTTGTYTFTDFYTNTTAMIQGSGDTTATDYYTMFGTMGSSQITSSSGYDISNYDDVVVLDGIEFDGEIISATLNVTFLDTQGNGENETFFDFSNGFEDFALFSAEDAASLDSANVGISDSTPSDIQFSQTDPVGQPAGAPLPRWVVIAAIPVVLLARKKSG